MGQTVYLLFVIHHVVPGDLYRNWKKEDNCIHTLSKVECKHKVPHSYQLGSSDKARMQGSKINGRNVSSVSDKWRPVSYIKSFVC